MTALTLTFLGKGGTGRSTIAIATAKYFANHGKRVLLVGLESGPCLSLLLDKNLTDQPQEIAPNFQAVQLQTTAMLERGWEEIKKLEAQYIKTPFFKNVFGQELGILPGMDSALALNALRQYDVSGKYDIIIADSTGNQELLRMAGMPEILSWYVRRFRQVIGDSDLGKALSPFVQPIVSTILNVDWSTDNFAKPTQEVNSLLDLAKNAISDPKQVISYLVTTKDKGAIAQAKYLWGCAQQVGLTVGGVIFNQGGFTEAINSEFNPLIVNSIPTVNDFDHSGWETIIKALPDFSQGSQAPKPIEIDIKERKVSLFLPNFDKKQIKLTQFGPEVTIEAGDQRRNILLPPSLSGKPVTGAKFQSGYLIISF